MRKVTDAILARGNPRITAKHPTTLMITKDGEVGPRGDCIIAVEADKGAADLRERLKLAIRSSRTIEVVVEVDGLKEVIRGYGHPGLSLTDPKDIVIRKSAFLCGRTLMIKADKAAADLSRDLVECLRDPRERVLVFVSSR